MTLEHTIISNILFQENYARQVYPFLKEEYFNNNSSKAVFRLIDTYVSKYNKFPSKEALYIELEDTTNVSQQEFNEAKEIIDQAKVDEATETQWLIDKTETFCQERAIYNGIVLSMKILEGGEKHFTKDAIPSLLSEALAVSFDKHIGHDYLEDFEDRFKYYHDKQQHIAFDLNYFNKITKGGLLRKTLNVVMASTGVGKTAFLCHCAAANLMDGYNVLYITLEISEEEISKRIDANLLDASFDDLLLLSENAFIHKVKQLKERTKGRLIVHEYPTASAGTSQFRFLLNELRIKKNFVPDVIYVDYINICMSSRFKFTQNVGMYGYVKAIAEELRGLAIEFNVPVFTATQVNREGSKNSDYDMDATSESFGLPMTADLLFALISTEELDALQQLLVKQLKSRYNRIDLDRRFAIGFDKDKMRLYDIDNPKEGLVGSEQPEEDDPPPFDMGAVHERLSNTSKFGKNMFEGIQ